MNKSFQAIVDFYKPAKQLAHQQDVIRTYRRSLRLIRSWAESRDVFNEQATLARNEFNQHYKAAPAEAARLLRETKERLQACSHPDPYIHKDMPGGTSFMRNPALPLSVVYPHGVPEWESKRRVNIDLSNIPDDQPYADKAFVDSISKRYWIDK